MTTSIATTTVFYIPEFSMTGALATLGHTFTTEKWGILFGWIYSKISIYHGIILGFTDISVYTGDVQIYVLTIIIWGMLLQFIILTA